METIARGIAYTDLLHMGRARVIATAVIQSPGGVALIDPGPSSCLETLRGSLAGAGIAITDVRALLLTHIHLDHAGAAGSLVRENPDIAVYVHERGAPHMIDPSKLLASAARLYGDQMDELWGPFLPVPAANVRVLAGGERIEAADRTFEVAYTPGHAWHHVSFLERASGIAFVGDVAGVRTGTDALRHAPDPAARHRRRGLAGEHRARPALGTRHAPGHALRRPRGPDGPSRRHGRAPHAG